MKRRWMIGVLFLVLLSVGRGEAQVSPPPLTLEESIKIALERNLRLHSALEGVVGAQFRKRAAMTDFLAKWTGQYSYTRYSDPTLIGPSLAIGKSVDTTRDVYNFSTSITQPLFAGGSILSNYRIEKLGVEVAQTDVETAKRDIILLVREGYFNILKAEKFVEVAKHAVKQFEAQLEVAKAFFDVGLIPKNDLLQSEVRLANARQGLVKAENDLAIAKSSFNSLLRRDINEPFSIVDILEYKPSTYRLEECLEEAIRQRPEIKNAELKVSQAKEAVKVAKSGFFPTISLSANYGRTSEELGLLGDMRSERWTVQTLATFTIGDWGKTSFKVGESKVRVTQAEYSTIQLKEGIILEVKEGYLNLITAEKNITVAEKAIEQAEENLRLNEERYKYQVATATDVLDAVTLLAQARVNYYSALSDFNIAKARLERAMGRIFP